MFSLRFIDFITSSYIANPVSNYEKRSDLFRFLLLLSSCSLSNNFNDFIKINVIPIQYTLFFSPNIHKQINRRSKMFFFCEKYIFFIIRFFGWYCKCVLLCTPSTRYKYMYTTAMMFRFFISFFVVFFVC